MSKPIVRYLRHGLWMAWGALAGLAGAAAQAEPCTGRGVELQVLGSGGPELQTGRASSSYLIWVDGKARVLVDSGGGSALRFGQSGAQVAELRLVLFSHLHVDHSADFPALVKSSFFEQRDDPLPVYGPPGNEFFPATTEWIAALFDGQRGAFRYLGGFLAEGRADYTIEPHDVAMPVGELRRVFAADGLSAWATPVTHGRIPALAWRVDVGGKRIAFSGDTRGDDGTLERLADGADLLVAHNAVPEGATGVERALHMPPSVIGRIAKAAGVRQLLLSHRMRRTLGQEAPSAAAIRAAYAGPLSFADDLACFRP